MKPFCLQNRSVAEVVDDHSTIIVVPQSHHRPRYKPRPRFYRDNATDHGDISRPSHGVAAPSLRNSQCCSPETLSETPLRKVMSDCDCEERQREDFRDTPTPSGPRSDPRLAPRLLQKYEAARCRANPNAPRLHLHDAESRPALDTNAADALSVSPASPGRTTDTAVPPLSTSGNVTSPAPTTIQQQAAFLNSVHGPATCKLRVAETGGVSATLSLIATQTPEPESHNAALALQSTTPAALPTLSASGLPIGNSESVDKCVSTSVVPSIAEVLPSITSADDLSTEMDFTASQVNEDNTPSPEGSWNTVSANRKPASTAHPRSELITAGIQLPPGTLTPKLPLYDLLSTIIAVANLSPKTSADVTLQAKSAQSLVFLKTHSPLTAHLLLSLTSLNLNAFRPSAAAVRLLYQQIPMLTFAPNPGASIAKSTPTHLSTPPASTFQLSNATAPKQLFSVAQPCAEPLSLHRPPLQRMSSYHLPQHPPPGSYAAKVKGTPPMCTSLSNTPSPSLSNESRSFDLRLAMLERNQREQQRVSDELQQKILALTQTLATTTFPLTSQLTELNKQLTTLTAPTSSSHVTELADMVETTTTAHHTRLFQLENSIVRILTTLETQFKQLESFTYMLNSLQESLPPAKKKERARVGASSTSKT
ncbi:hypothetical protein HPB51_027117 [Rhipicephalus microplus]|uniref:Uncharacterized protein n=1 Tax=Rhipicephalus microplus TaxID=6941 RepID=A0A9J6D100_RHIMP|nr:hypothetical protein HPB51_027117 [Rhipicephalus microplus]